MFSKDKKKNFEEVLKHFFSFKNETKSLEPLSEVFQSIKKENFNWVLSYFKENEDIRKNFIYYLHHLFEGKPFNLSLTEANILTENSFFSEFKKRLLDKLLPAVGNENSVWYIIDHICVNPRKDLQFLQNIPEDQMQKLFEILEIERIIQKVSVKRELLFSINILAWRSIGNALQTEVCEMLPEYKQYDNPFLALQDEMDLLKRKFDSDAYFQMTSKDETFKQIKVYLEQCLNFVHQAFKNSSIYGISSKTNQALLKIQQQLNRLSEIINLLVIDTEEDEINNSKLLVFSILKYKSHKNNIIELFDQSTTLMSHLITNHTAETGVHYISSTRKEYVKMFWSASGGGIIVGVLCILKLLYSFSPGSEFSHAFMYALNYAMGFMMIYLMGFSLATKQPAMTAATMAKVLSDESSSSTKLQYTAFAHLVSKLFRTQFIAFIGNVLWAFPVSMIIIYGLDVFFGQNFATEKSSKLLKDLDVFQSKALLHASLAGFYLFISGVISGNIGNNSVYFGMPKRIEKNPILCKFLGKKTALNLSNYYSRNWAGIVSNFWFGVCLGVTAPIGIFLGLDLDIRHITFAAGNFAIGLYGKGFSVSSHSFWMGFVTVFLIGFFNFIVSFGLSIMLALRSRKVNLGGTKEIFKAIFKYFLKNPLRFFIPIPSKTLDDRAIELIKTSEAKESASH